MIKRVINFLVELKFKYLLRLSIVRVKRGGSIQIVKNCKIIKSTILVDTHSNLIFDNNVIIRATKIQLHQESKLELKAKSKIEQCNIMLHGDMFIDEYTILKKGANLHPLTIKINEGSLKVGKFNMLRCQRFLIRFGGQMTMGTYNNINEGSEIRVDERVEIGSFNQISFNCMIWDTNTHNMYPFNKRRKLTREKFPNFGYEFEKPKTAPVKIGNDGWIGREACVLKGSEIGNKVVLGFRCVLVGDHIEDNVTVTTQFTQNIRKNSI